MLHFTAEAEVEEAGDAPVTDGEPAPLPTAVELVLDPEFVEPEDEEDPLPDMLATGPPGKT